MNDCRQIKVRAAMPGNPSFYEGALQDYSPEALGKLKEYGINTVFVNLAWSRPHIDMVCLEHCAVSKTYPLLSDPETVEKSRKKLEERLGNIKKFGMKAMLLAGIPMYRDYSLLPEEYQVLKGQSVSRISDGAVTCIKSPAVMTLYRELTDDLTEHFPELDGMLVYTYDELAEVCDEDGDCPRCRGIAQEERIPEFLNALFAHLQERKKGFIMWWEPWELAWMQVYGILERLDRRIAVSCHSTLHEVYFANHPDLWFRSIAALCREQGRDLIGELFMGGTGEDTGFTPAFPCPRLVTEQIRTVAGVGGVTGIKEYYGICTPYMSVNELAMKAAFAGKTDTKEVLREISAHYCGEENDKLLDFWELGSRVLELFPWELSWVMRQYNYHPYDPAYWGKTHFLDLMKTPWNTPSWLANRRSYYMICADRSIVTETCVKDLKKRFDEVEVLLKRGIDMGKELLEAETEERTEENPVQDDLSRVRATREQDERLRKELSLQCESLQLFLFFTICRKNHLVLSCELESLKKGGENLTVLADLLKSEKKNAEDLAALIEGSEVPYLLNTDTIQKGIQQIDRYLADLELGRNEFLNRRGDGNVTGYCAQ